MISVDIVYIINQLSLVVSVMINILVLYKLIVGKASKRFIKRTQKVLEYIKETRDSKAIAEFVKMSLNILTNVGLTDTQINEVRKAIKTVLG